MVATGTELLEFARSAKSGDLDLRFGPRATPAADEVERPALVAALLADSSHEDLPIVQALTRHEVAARAEADDGCGDVLLACAWMLFLGGEPEDAALIWAAKNVNFDAYCYIDSVFLLPGGLEATVHFARGSGHADLLRYVEGTWISDPEVGAEDWRSSPYFEGVPPADAPAVELARWLRGTP